MSGKGHQPIQNQRPLRIAFSMRETLVDIFPRKQKSLGENVMLMSANSSILPTWRRSDLYLRT
jgi:hypothetical protein